MIDIYKKNLRVNYSDLVKKWNFYIDSYVGGEDYTNKNYLIKTPIESEKQFQSRKKLAAFTNYCRPTIMRYVNFIYASSIERINLDNITSFLKNNLDSFFSKVLKYLLIYGEIFIVYDTDSIEKSIVTLDKSIIFDLSIIHPQQVYFFDENTIVYVENYYSSKFDTSKVVIWTPFEKIIDYKNMQERIPHALNRVPYLRLVLDENVNGCGESLLRDIAPWNQTIFNLESALSNELYMTSFNSLMIPYSKEIEQIWKQIIPTETDENGKITYKFEPKEFMLVPNGGDYKYLDKNMESAKVKIEYIKQLENKIKYLSNQRVGEILQQSGIAKKYDNMDFNSELKFFSLLMEGYELDLYTLLNQANAISQENVELWEVKYRKNYDVMDKTDKFQKGLELYDKMEDPIIKAQLSTELLEDYRSL